ncbi:hypothetical protein [Bifidobacterium vansinderenii]|uniref:Uncharacterized protein n=1 Tax=Bifidobacterium vansinderenii TaxID=1984871 RepID=A0A229VZF9_9BIFI|nr:hypothetical protein [Bifidobacterium vansinderenii]OXN00800.1 hypothetical protein Tam10B_0755 [Bifidobacterium vansinderenii]
MSAPKTYPPTLDIRAQPDLDAPRLQARLLAARILAECAQAIMTGNPNTITLQLPAMPDDAAVTGASLTRLAHIIATSNNPKEYTK